MMLFNIKDFEVGHPLKPYIIAEIGVNHEGEMHLAKRLIREAKEGGAHAAKFQSYKAEKIASKHSPAYWDQTKEPTGSQFALFKKYDSFSVQNYIELAEYCNDLNIDFMSTPFDLEAVTFLEPLMPIYKIASADITNVPLLRRCAEQGKPVVLSTGASSIEEIRFAVNTLRNSGANNITLLHCVLNYPTPLDRAQLGMIDELKKEFPDCLIGYSDHVVPDETISALEVAALKGAVIIEKHFTHDKTLPGNDHYHAMNKTDLQAFVKKLEIYQVLTLGSNKKDLSNEELSRMHARRSIVSKYDIKKGELFDETNLICKRPAHGISPIHWDEIVGTRANADIPEDMHIQWEMISRH
jgi:N-acetylneuraminate synthase